jgi:hypothetical protein
MNTTTYRELAELINNMSEEDKDKALVLFIPNDGEYYHGRLTRTNETRDILTPPHPTITTIEYVP